MLPLFVVAAALILVTGLGLGMAFDHRALRQLPEPLHAPFLAGTRALERSKRIGFMLALLLFGAHLLLLPDVEPLRHVAMLALLAALLHGEWRAARLLRALDVPAKIRRLTRAAMAFRVSALAAAAILLVVAR